MRQSEELAEACRRGDAERVRVLLEVENCDPEAEFKNRVIQVNGNLYEEESNESVGIGWPIGHAGDVRALSVSSN